MSKITNDPNIDRVEEADDHAKFISIFLDEVKTLLNSGLKFSDNFDAKFVDVYFSSVAETKINHGLGRTPAGYLITRKSANMNVYDGSSTWNNSSMYLQSTLAGNVTLLVF